MKKLFLILALLLAPAAANAQIVGAFPYTFTNGTSADANQVMANYNYLKTSVNNGALPLAGGVLTGGVSGTTLSLSGMETVGGTLAVTGATTLNSTLTVVGASTLAATGVVGGLTTDTLAVSSTSSFTGALTASGGVVGNVTGNVTGAVTGNASTATALAAGQTISASGDATGTSGSFNGTAGATVPLTLATVNASPGTYANATVVVNAKGLATSVSVSPSASTSVNGPTTLATTTQAIAGSSTTVAVTPAGLAAQGFTSSTISISALANSQTVAHGLGVKPLRIACYLRNTTSELNYAVGDEIPCPSYSFNGSAFVGAYAYIINSTYVGYVIGTSITIANATTGGGATLTNGNWALVIRAWAN